MTALVPQCELLGMWLLTSPWMLFWALAAVVPVLIHLWSRRRYDEVPWAAMRFLLRAIRKNARRWRMEQLLLLAVRMLVLILLAAALADPIVALLGDGTTPRGPVGDTHTVLVLDTSYSMDYRQSDTTRFDVAKSLASEFVRRGLQGDGFTLIELSDPPRVVVGDPVFDRESMVTEIAQVTRTDGAADLEATLAEVQRVLGQAKDQHSRLHRGRVCFFTDLGQNSWSAVTGESVKAALSRLAKDAELRLFDVGQSDGQNVAVTRVAASEAVVTVGAPVRLDVELENFGSQDRSQQVVNYLVDGQEVAEMRANVEGGSRANVTAFHKFQTPGEHVVEVHLGDDRLMADNRRWLCLHVRESIEVLCVEGKSGAAHHVALALQPTDDSQARVRPVVRSEIALLEEELDRYDCICLCNVGRLGNDEARILHRFLQRGGGAVIVVGDQVQASNYNSVLGPDAGQDRCLSVRLDGPVELGEYWLDPREYQHAIVEPFRGHERAGLLTTPIWKYLKAEVDPATAAVVLAFQNGDPALVEQSVGAGRVVLLLTDASSVSLDRTTDPPTPWSALAAWPSFPPLMQQMLQAAVQGRGRVRNVVVGDALCGWLPPGSPDTSVVVRDPSGRQQRVPVEVDSAQMQWTYGGTSRGGVYQVSWQDEGAASPRLYAANLDISESRLDRFDAELLPSEFRRESGPDELDEPRWEVRKPKSYFRHLLAAVLSLLLTESMLAWFFGRGT